MKKLKTHELNRPTVEEFAKTRKLPVVVVLDNIRSGLNVGSIFRTSDAFAVEKIILCGITPQPPHREINKTALGATNSVPWVYNQNVNQAISDLVDQNYKVFLIEQTTESTALTNLDINNLQKIAIVFGNEVDGVSDSLLTMVPTSIEIQQFGTKHSFNVAVSAGIVLWEISRQLRGF